MESFDIRKASDTDLACIADLNEIFDLIRIRLTEDLFIKNKFAIDLRITNEDKFEIKVGPKSEDTYIIYISIGTIRSVWNLLILSLCDPGILDSYPEDDTIQYKPPTVITAELLYYSSILPAFGFPDDYRSTDGIIRQNITGARRELCEDLYNWIIDHLLYHEVMHIARDHFSYYDIYRNTGISEEKKMREENKFVRLLELDADMHALDYKIRTMPEFQHFKEMPVKEIRAYMFLEFFGYLIIQQLTDRQNKPIAEQLEETHPPPVMRAICYDRFLRTIFIEHGLATAAIVTAESLYAWNEASKIAVKLGFPPGRWRDNMDEVSFKILNSLTGEYKQLEQIIDHDNVAENHDLFNQFISEYSFR